MTEKIGKLCKQYGIYYIVDGAQGAGIYEIDVGKMGIDALCIPAHKGLYGPQGLGMIIYGNGNIGLTFIEGGTGINSLESEMPDFLPERYEAGTMSTPLICGLCESLKWLKDIGLNAIRLHEEKLYDTAYALLNENNRITVYKMNDYSGNTLMFNVDTIYSSNLATLLDKEGICTRSGFHCSPLAHKKLKTGDAGAVRIGFSAFNTQKEIFTFIEVLNKIIKENKRSIRQ